MKNSLFVGFAGLLAHPTRASARTHIESFPNITEKFNLIPNVTIAFLKRNRHESMVMLGSLGPICCFYNL